MDIKDYISRELKAFAGLVFPRRCIVCGEVLDVEERHICEGCAGDFPYTWSWAFEENPVEERLWKRMGIVAAASLFFYRKDGGYAELLHDVKYGGNLKLGRELGRELGEKMRQSGRFAEVQAVVPVPLHPLRRWRRGYNQSEVIARGIAEGLSDENEERTPRGNHDENEERTPRGNLNENTERDTNSNRMSKLDERKKPWQILSILRSAKREAKSGAKRDAKRDANRNAMPLAPDLLKRSRYTRTQTRLRGEGKRRNVEGAFSVNLREAERLKGEGVRHILVVDDLMTSGSTLEAAVKPLLPHFLVSIATIGFVE